MADIRISARSGDRPPGSEPGPPDVAAVPGNISRAAAAVRADVGGRAPQADTPIAAGAGDVALAAGAPAGTRPDPRDVPPDPIGQGDGAECPASRAQDLRVRPSLSDRAAIGPRSASRRGPFLGAGR